MSRSTIVFLPAIHPPTMLAADSVPRRSAHQKGRAPLEARRAKKVAMTPKPSIDFDASRLGLARFFQS